MNLSAGRFFKILLLFVAVSATACNSTQRPALEQPLAGTVAQVYECRDGYEFLARIEGDVAHLFLPDRTVSLIHQQSAAGTKYSRGDVTFWLWDDEATLEIGHEARMSCSLDPKRTTLK